MVEVAVREQRRDRGEPVLAQCLGDRLDRVLPGVDDHARLALTRRDEVTVGLEGAGGKSDYEHEPKLTATGYGGRPDHAASGQTERRRRNRDHDARRRSARAWLPGSLVTSMLATQIAVPAVALGRAQRHVRVQHQVLEVQLDQVAEAVGRHADRRGQALDGGRQLAGDLRGHRHAPDAGADPLGDRQRGVQLGLGQQHHELVTGRAAVAAGQVAWTWWSGG